MLTYITKLMSILQTLALLIPTLVIMKTQPMDILVAFLEELSLISHTLY